jgi:hypothetical protein
VDRDRMKNDLQLGDLQIIGGAPLLEILEPSLRV